MSYEDSETNHWRKIWLVVLIIIIAALAYRYYYQPRHHTPVYHTTTTPASHSETAASQPVTAAAEPSQVTTVSLGAAQAKTFAGGKLRASKSPVSYLFPKKLSLNQWALRGKWWVNPQDIVAAASDTAIKMRFSGQQVYLTAESTNKKPIRMRVLFNSVEVTNYAGSDVKHGMLTVDVQHTYQVLNLPKSMKGQLTLIVESPGVRLYKFTVE